MAEAYLLDTNVLILCIRGRVPFVRLVNRLVDEGSLYVCPITRLEIFVGQRQDEIARTRHFLSLVEEIVPDRDTFDRAEEYIIRYRRMGITLSIPDALIAATASQYDLPLVTTNVKDYPMEDLQTLNATEMTAMLDG